MESPLLSIRNLSKSYSTGTDRRLSVLEDVSFDVWPGELVAIVGESGSGKSTLLHLLGALDRPDKGEVVFGGENIFRKNDQELASFRNKHIGFIFQFHHLLPEFDAIENVMMPALISGATIAESSTRAGQLLTAVGLGERLTHKPSALSGGEQQRVAVARALMNRPSVILGDEPTGNLDTDNARSLHNELLRLSREYNQTFVLATHSIALADMADRVLRLSNRSLAPQPKG